ncbi:hypothetical protein [Roseimarinus sediminis]|uniref:hypothetical protein n=1 Tax=Roseimarinus sediminis TaxID=1610899 RepID=UPI003D2594EF
MKITIVDGNLPTAQKQHFTNDMALELKRRGHEVFIFKISEKKVNYCNGCWNCWLKTPGR